MGVKDIVRSNPGGVISRAYYLAEKAHAGQKRKTGEAYFNHALATADILLSWRLDEASVAAGLLHDTVEDTPLTLAEIEKEFGAEIAFLVDGVTKLGRIKYRGAENVENAGVKVENLRKMIFAISEDLRVVFIKLADRLHNMRTLAALPPPKQKRIALETNEIYAPIAYRLGMQNLAGELNDLAFPYLHPQEYKWLKTNVREEYEDREKYLHQIKPILVKALKVNGLVPLAIDFRAKRMSSLYYKLLRHDMDINKIYDLVAMRIIVNNVSECYAALGIIHHLWPPLPGRIKDYIAMPKPNGYRSLHTTVIGPQEKFVEIQIRTKQMHEENEYGIAAHWLYQQKKSGGLDKSIFKRIAEELHWVRQLREWQSQMNVNSEDFIQAMKIDFFKDRIFVITPKGDVIDLPAGATPVDFAYHIHTEVGNTCVGARVNNAFVPLDHELRSGDVVEIITQKNKMPSEDWLKFVKTSIARNHIREALRARGKRLKAKIEPSRAELRLVVKDRPGLIKDISTIISRSHVNIVSFQASNPHGGKFPVNKIEIATTNREKIEKLILKLKKLKEVQEIGYQLV